MKIKHSKILFMTALLASSSIFILCQSALAFNPQPEPPAHEEKIPPGINPAPELRDGKAKPPPVPPPPPDMMHRAKEPVHMEPGDDEKPREPVHMEPGDDEKPREPVHMEPGNDEKPHDTETRGIIIENKPVPRLKR